MGLSYFDHNLFHLLGQPQTSIYTLFLSIPGTKAYSAQKKNNKIMMRATSTTLRHFTTKATGVGRSTAGSQSRDSGRRVAAIVCAGLTFSASGAGVAYYLNLQNNFTTTTTPAFLAGGGSNASSREEEQRRRNEAMRRRQQQGSGGSGSSSSGSSGGVNKWLIVGGVAIVSLFSFALTRYKRCSPNEVLVVFGQTGAKGPAKIVHGGGTVVWPIIQGESTF